MKKLLVWMLVLAVALLIAVQAAGANTNWTRLQIKVSDNIHGVFFFDVEPSSGPVLKNGNCAAKIAITIKDEIVQIMDSTAVYAAPPIKNRLPQIKISGEILSQQMPGIATDDIFEAIKKAGAIDARQ